MVKVQNIRSVDIGVPDLEAAASFYTDVWGLAVAERTPQAVYLRGSGKDHHLLALHQRETARVLRYDLLAAREDIEALLDSAVAAGAGVFTPPAPNDEPGGGYGFSFLDIDGRTVRILADPEELEPMPGHDPLPIRLEHVLFNSASPPDAVDFYIRALGFRVIDDMNGTSFLNCGETHHAIGISGRGNTSTLNHIAFTMENMDALMRSVARLRSHGHETAWGIGRHGPGNSIYAYFVGPNQEIIEFAAEVASIGPDHVPRSHDYWSTVYPQGQKDYWGLSEISDEFKAALGRVPFVADELFHA